MKLKFSALLLLMGPFVYADEWPTYRYDNARSGFTENRLQLPLQPIWRFSDQPPKPTWPPPARADYFHKKFNLKPRITYDHAFHLIAKDGLVHWGSSSQNTVYGLDQKSGGLKWKFYTGGPVRLAPTLVEDRLVFGCDDGFIYCLNRTNGQLIWKTLPGNETVYLPANGRIASNRPIRSGILVQDGKGYYCAGILPSQGLHHGVIDIQTGEVVEEKPIPQALQGYLSLNKGKLLSGQGRVTKQHVLRKLKDEQSKPATPVNPAYPFCAIANENYIIRGGENVVAVFDREGNEKWKTTVEGKAYALAISGNQLLVSTDQGRIYAFGHEKKDFTVSVQIRSAERLPNPLAAKVAKQLEFKKGYGLALGEKAAQLVLDLVEHNDLQYVIQVPQSETVTALRKTFGDAGLYGRVTVHQGALDHLPYNDYIFNLVLHDQEANLDEIKRVLCPGKGLALPWNKPEQAYHKPHLTGAGEWSHFYADPGNSSCSDDRLITSKLALQWIGEPGPRNMVDRHNRPPAPLFKNGRMFVTGTDWYAAVDGYNGTVLWEKDVPGSMRPSALKNCSNMAATDAHLFVVNTNQCLMIEAEYGQIEKTFSTPDPHSDWGYLAVLDDKLFGSTTLRGVSRFDLRPSSWKPGYAQNQPVVCSSGFFALSPHTQKPLWTYHPTNNWILNPTIAIGRKTVFFIESSSPDESVQKSGKGPLQTLFAKPPKLVALDYETGRKKWAVDCDLKMLHSIYLIYKDGKVLVSGSRIGQQLTYDLVCYDAGSGNKVWEEEYICGGDKNGSHGELTQHPAIVGNQIYLTAASFSLSDGKRNPAQKWSRRGHGCGTFSASSSHLFWRGANPTMGRIDDGSAIKINRVSRPGCWINIIPVGGLVLIPEASSGCSCGFSVQSSFAYRPIKPDPSEK